jgi:addiction module HigA family antidote
MFRMPNTFNPVHPGLYVKENYIQKQKLTVTKAAELIGLSRPSLSNFLNGKVSATTEMATRLERAFGIPSQVILELQAKFDAHASDKIGVVQKLVFMLLLF